MTGASLVGIPYVYLYSDVTRALVVNINVHWYRTQYKETRQDWCGGLDITTGTSLCNYRE